MHHVGTFAMLKARLEARQRWEAENPELAEMWSEAIREDFERHQRREMERRERDYASAVPEHLTRAGFPLDAVEALKDLRETETTKAARRFLDAPVSLDGRFLVFFGRRGVGKTTAAALVARGILLAWLKKQGGDPGWRHGAASLPVAFVLSSSFSRLSGYDREDRAWFEHACAVQLLVLDDLGTEHLTEYGKSMLDELLTRRHGDRLRTVITTNLDKKAFAARVGERLFDRISTSGVSCVSVGESLRKRGGQ